MCAGIQKSGMVLPTTNFINPPQSTVEITFETEIPFDMELLFPAIFLATFSRANLASIQVSVMRWEAIKTGAKVRFMIADM